MNKPKYIILLVILTTFSCVSYISIKSLTRHDAIVDSGVFLKNNILYKNGSNKPYTGTVTAAVASSILEYDVVDGVKNGRFNVYADGFERLMISGAVRNNMNQGEWIYYYPNGKIESKGEFNKDVITGKWTWYYENGTIKEEGYYINGEREGKWIAYKEDGIIQSQVTFRKGTATSQIKTEKIITT
jgi:antitoxin component YwqK of YwqJK toxin-antitoxin module